MDTRCKDMYNYDFITVVYSPKIEYLIILMKCSICKLTGHNKRRCPTLQEFVEPVESVEPVEPIEPVEPVEPILQKYFATSSCFQEDFPLIHILIQHTSVSIDVLLRHMLPGHSHTSLQCPASEDQPDSHPSEEIEYSVEPSISKAPDSIDSSEYLDKSLLLC